MLARGGYLLAQLIPDTKPETLESISHSNAKCNRKVKIDELAAYTKLYQTGDHTVVNQSAKDYVNSTADIDEVENSVKALQTENTYF